MLRWIDFKVLYWEQKLENALTNSHPAIMEKILTNISPKILESISKKRALSIFHLASEDVPAYKKFLKSKKFSRTVTSIKDFALVPPVDKKSYVYAYPLHERCVHGKIPREGSIYESSGSTGKPTIWLQDLSEDDTLFSAIKFEYYHVYRAKPEITLSTWATGPWVTGNKFCEAAAQFSLLKNTTGNMDNIVDTLKTFGPKKHYLIAGYPPFIKQLVERLTKEIDLKKYKIDFALGGEGYTLDWLQYLRSMLPPKSLVISSYGASDVDIGLGFESGLCYYIRELASKNVKLRKELFGSEDALPMLFQYNPLVHYVETYNNPKNKKKELLFTLLTPNAALTKVRYNLHDEGDVFTHEELIAKVEKYYPEFIAKYEKKWYARPILPLPFMFVKGRTGGMITIGSANVYPKQVELCLFRSKNVVKKMSTFKISKKHVGENKKEQFTIHIELKKGMKKDSTLSKEIASLIQQHLGTYNNDFAILSRSNPQMKHVEVLLYTFNDPFFAKDKDKIKKKYIES